MRTDKQRTQSDVSVRSDLNTVPSTDSDSALSSRQMLLKPQFLTGLGKDVQRRLLPYYLEEWKLSTTFPLVVNAAISSFIRQLIPGLIFAGWIDQETNGKLSTIEVLISMGAVGMFYAVFSGRPLVLVGVSGPAAILLGTSHGLSKFFQADFFPFFWWMCIWTGTLHLATACFGLVNLAGLITPFSSQIFEFFVAISFIYKSVYDLIHPFLPTTNYISEQAQSSAYASLLLGLMTFSICWKLHFAETWVYFTARTRSALANHNILIATVIATCFSYIPGLSKSEENDDIIQRVRIIDSTSFDWTPSFDRTWLQATPGRGIDITGIFAALIPGSMLYFLFFLEHNMSSAIAQASKYKLKKSSTYHWDFFALGLSIIGCGFLGLPPCCGITPQNPMHTQSLCTKTQLEDGHEAFVSCAEQRWSALIQAGLMVGVLSVSSILPGIPVGYFFGVLLYFGVCAMSSSGIWTRIALKFVMSSRRPQIAIVTEVSSWATVQRYTWIQVGLSLITFGVAFFTDYVYLFPLVLVICIPLRQLIISFIFKKEDLIHLDPKEMTEEEYAQESRELNDAFGKASGVDASAVFRGIHEFRRNDLIYDVDKGIYTSGSIDGQAAETPRSSPASPTSQIGVDIEIGPQSTVQSLSKLTRTSSVASVEPTFCPDWNVWTQLFASDPATREYCGTEGAQPEAGIETVINTTKAKNRSSKDRMMKIISPRASDLFGGAGLTSVKSDEPDGQESILRTKSSPRKRGPAGKITFANNAETLELDIKRQHSDFAEM